MQAKVEVQVEGKTEIKARGQRLEAKDKAKSYEFGADSLIVDWSISRIVGNYKTTRLQDYETK